MSAPKRGKVVDIEEARRVRIGAMKRDDRVAGFVQEMVRSSLIGIGFPESYAEAAASDMAKDWKSGVKTPSWRSPE